MKPKSPPAPTRFVGAGLQPRHKSPEQKGASAPEAISPTTTEGRFAYEGLDRVIHERARLSVLTSLISTPKGLLFNELKQLCSLTDGNLSRHLTVLESERMVVLTKEDDRTRPQTICRITPTGRKRYLEYLSTLEQVIKDAARIAAKSSTTEKSAKPHRNLNPSPA
jgi:DNA-binding transcriptional ArsR family regulator